MTSWVARDPGVEYRLWTADDAADVVRDVGGSAAADAFAATTHPAARSDLFRYAWLLRVGGWYVDAEHEALVPMTRALAWDVDLVVVQRSRSIPNGFVGAASGSPVVAEVFELACRNVQQGIGGTVGQQTGPHVWRAVVGTALEGPEAASAVVLPADVVFRVVQRVHNEADYKVVGHWLDHG
jgi:mannosyltransferase OCH1-like enzyme